ncbi:hypothetical protein HZS_2019 [Henneguya salminicola]|nr:hypothetical protein HZS_2019 [Henneguya salminicola]
MSPEGSIYNAIYLVINLPEDSNTMPIKEPSTIANNDWLMVFTEELVKRICRHFNLSFSYVIKIMVSDSSVTVRYKGMCPYTKTYHRSNNQILTINRSLIELGCYDVDCQKNNKLCIKIKTGSIIDETAMGVLFSDGLKEYIKSIMVDVDPGVLELNATNPTSYEFGCTNQLIPSLKENLHHSPSKYNHVISPKAHTLMKKNDPLQLPTVDTTPNIVGLRFQQFNIHAKVISIGTINTGVNTRLKKKSVIECCDNIRSISNYTIEQKNSICECEYLKVRTDDNLVFMWATFNELSYVYCEGVHYTYDPDF